MERLRQVAANRVSEFRANGVRGQFDAARVLGIVAIFGLVAWSVSLAQGAIAGIEQAEAQIRTDAMMSETVEQSELADQAPPRYLAFAVGMASGAYDIAEPSDGSETPRESSRSSGSTDQAEAAGQTEQPGVLANYVPPELGPLSPGLYGTAFGTEDCSFELRRSARRKAEKVIGQEYVPNGRVLVSINQIEPDRFIASPQCGDWVPWSPVAEPLQVADNGDYWIGDLQAGTWTVPRGCIWEKVVGFRGASLWDVEQSGRGPAPLVVDEDTLGVRIRACQDPLTLDSAS